ncbi:MAG: T9SS type A sorting domain-containing protein, partial [Bacteroidota bacterium]
DDGTRSITLDLTLVVDGAPGAVTLLTPADNVVIGISGTTNFSWTSDPNADEYKLFLIRDSGVGNFFTTSATSVNVGAPPLIAPEGYTWYVEAINTSCSATGVNSATRNFTTALSSLSNTDSPVIACGESTASFEVGFIDGPVTGPASLSVQSTDLPGSVMIDFSPSTVSNGNTFDVNISNITGIAGGSYNITVLTTGTSGTETIDLTLDVEGVSNVSPDDGQQVLISGSGNGIVAFSWDGMPGATSYTIEIDGFFPVNNGTSTSRTLNFGPTNDGEQFTFSIVAATPGGDVVSCDNTFTFVTALPVEWLTFTAKASEGNGLLHWNVIQDGQGESYTIERQIANGERFMDIDVVMDNGLEGETSYNFIDKTVKAGNTYYYRLRQQDFDEAISYSPIREVKFYNGLSPGDIKLIPNPSGNYTNIVLPAGIAVSSYQVYSTFGQLLLEGQLTGQSTVLDLSTLPNAVYHVVVSGAAYRSVEKLVKQ